MFSSLKAHKYPGPQLHLPPPEAVMTQRRCQIPLRRFSAVNSSLVQSCARRGPFVGGLLRPGSLLGLTCMFVGLTVESCRLGTAEMLRCAPHPQLSILL